MRGLVAVALLLAGCAAPAALDGRAPRVISASGVGRVTVKPDTALVQIGAEARAPALADATADVDRRMREVLARVKALGVAESDIATVTYVIDPVVTQRSPDDPARIVGYRVSNVAQVRIRDLAAVGRILDAAIAAGANTLPSLQFTVDDRAGPESRARVLAVRAAAAKAAQMAAAAGVRLGELVLLSEGGGVRPLMAQGRYATLSAPGPVEPGQLEIEIAVEAQYLIEK
jgi:uncharacterized protein